jgi:mannose-1-phosphate guanylyltransferase/mannose-1-phosphate guanylyltransferase/mannose-6-phosphate isomerase
MTPVVLSGGSGTRLWPLSRASLPKQFLDLFEGSLLGRTLARVAPLGAPWVVGVAGTETLTRRAAAAAGVAPERLVFEPEPRNTAAAVALACHLLRGAGRGGAVAGVFPADHRIADEEAFRRAVRLAAAGARAGWVVTLGIRPDRPETGYGWIERTGEELARDGEGLAAFRAQGFREKPDAATAAAFAASGRFVWNAGMFVFRPDDLAGHFARLAPDLWRAIAAVDPAAASPRDLAAAYRDLPGESFDVAVMEKLDRHATIPCDPGWSDVGSWDEVARLDRADGRRRGAVVGLDGGEESFVLPHRDKVYAVVGAPDLLVVDTADALLVARRGSSQAVRTVVERLAAQGRPEAAAHPFEERPWGRFEVLREEGHFKAKLLRVDPGQRLSYQAHRHRQEHWVVVRGRPEITLDGRLLHPAPGEAVVVPAGARHRIANPGAEPVELVEVQTGSYFGEDDIERFEDDYDRV